MSMLWTKSIVIYICLACYNTEIKFLYFIEFLNQFISMQRSELSKLGLGVAALWFNLEINAEMKRLVYII